MKLKYEFHIVEIGDSSIAVPVGESTDVCQKIIDCNETAALILKMLHDTTSEEAIVQEIQRQFDAEDGVIEEYVHRFIAELQQNGFLDL